MDNGKDSQVTKRKHFAKLHERIQNKYNKMQRKLEKSKSVDSLTSFGDENFEEKVASVCDISRDVVDDVFIENKRQCQPLMHTVIVEDVGKQEITYADVETKEISVSEYESSVPNDKDVKVPESDNVFGNDWSISIESLNELEKKCDEKDEDTSEPRSPKLSIRKRIGSRISAVKERRREEKERNMLKNKKKDSLDTGKKVEKLIFSNSTKSELRLNKDKKLKIATVTIALIEVTGLELDEEDKPRSLLCKLSLGAEKYKSRVAKNVDPTRAKWQELFSMNMYIENFNLLTITLWDDSRKYEFIGRNILDLTEMEREKTHSLNLILDGNMSNVEIFLLLTITGTPLDNLLVDLDDYKVTRSKMKEEKKRFAFYQISDLSTIGRLFVIVYGAKGLSSSDCFCSLQLINERRQTQTEYKTNDPNWMKTFSFTVTDITSILQVTVYDERRGDEVGRLAIPLLQIRNGAKVWYSLKDETMRERSKGNYPRILIEMRIFWNLVKAALRVVKPKEPDLLEIEDKFDRKLFLKNIARAKIVVLWTVDVVRSLKACFEWESRKWNTIGLAVWLLFNWYYEAWMLPLLLLTPFIWFRPQKYFLVDWKYYLKPAADAKIDDDEKEERTTLRQKFNNMQELVQSVQSFIGKFASFGESVKNLFNFSVPFLSFFSIFLLLAISIILYCIPAKYILIAWGIKKYIRKIIWPHREPHNEVMDLLSRVPDDEILSDCEIIPLETTSELRMEEDQV